MPWRLLDECSLKPFHIGACYIQPFRYLLLFSICFLKPKLKLRRMFFSYFLTSKSPWSSHLSTISLILFTIFSFFSKTFINNFFAASATNIPSEAISDSSSMHWTVQHPELNDVFFGREQLPIHLSLISWLKSSGTVQHSIGNFDTFGHILQSFPPEVFEPFADVHDKLWK